MRDQLYWNGWSAVSEMSGQFSQNLHTIIPEGGMAMDLVKIGSYIAEKRKSLGMTQKQLAEKLGKSDKSVSKWERGVSQS